MTKYEAIAHELEEKIDRGDYGDRLPTEKELVSLFGVSRVTIRKSIELLQSKYPLQRTKKGGTRILDQNSSHSGKQIVLIMPNNTYESTQIISGAEEICSHSHFSLTLKFSEFSEKSERAIIQELLELDIAGFLVYPATKSANEDLFLNIIEKGIPLVFIDRSPARLICPSVSINNQQTAINIVDYLFSLGHRDIAMFAGSLLLQQSTLERFWGYLSSMKKHNLPVSKNSIYEVHDYDDLHLCLDKFFKTNTTTTAVFCSDDTIAVRFIDEALHRGFRIPEDFSVVGIDNRKIPEYNNAVALTTVNQPYRELGRRAAQILVDMLGSEKQEIVKLYLPAELIVRESTKPPKPRHSESPAEQLNT